LFLNPASAAPASPTFARCEALAQQRGSEAGSHTHANFMADCLAGKVPEMPLAQPASARQTRQMQSYARCEALAEQRKSDVGSHTHDRFISACMAGRVR
jgi:hypothetical protein